MFDFNGEICKLVSKLNFTAHDKMESVSGFGPGKKHNAGGRLLGGLTADRTPRLGGWMGKQTDMLAAELVLRKVARLG
jgi:hypothetical protein